jgi:hypothetical protein
MPGVSAFEAICCQGPCKEHRPGTHGLPAAISVTSAKTDGDVARRLIARAELSGAAAAVRRWSRWWMAHTGGALATVMPCVLRVEAQEGRGRPMQNAVETCRAPTGPTCRPTDRPTARPRRRRLELRSAHGWPCRGPASDRVDRRSRLVSVPGRGPSQCRAADRVSVGPPTESVPGRRPCQCRAADRVSTGSPIVSVPGRGPNRRRVEDRTGDGPMTESMAAREPSRRRAGDRVGDGPRTELEAGRGQAGERVGTGH